MVLKKINPPENEWEGVAKIFNSIFEKIFSLPEIDMKKKEITILLVDDEPDIIEIVRYNLSAEGYAVKTAKNGKEAIKQAIRYKPQLILLDVMMPGMDGMATCRKLREIPELQDTVIAFLTARGEDYSQLSGFEAGADDYITKPIKPKVLMGKVKALLRRFKSASPQGKMQLGNLIIDHEQYKIHLNGGELSLPRKEFELLSLLTSKPGKVFRREDILSQIWGDDVVVVDRTIDVHIRKLREKLGDDKFETVKGVGYKFVNP